MPPVGIHPVSDCIHALTTTLLMQIPQEFPQLLALRTDFALELGFVQTMQVPLPECLRGQISDMVMPNGEHIDFDTLNRVKAAYRLPRFVGYFYESTNAVVTDGSNSADVPYFGLFSEMLDHVCRAAISAGLSTDLGFSNPIVCPDDADQAHPQCLLLHDTHTGACHLAEFNAGTDFMTKANWSTRRA